MNIQTPSRAGLLALTCLLTFPFLASAASKDGKTIFLDHRCNLCHSVDDLGIHAKLKGEGLPDKAPDLSHASNLIPSEAWLEGWLHKKETKDGKTHPMKFVGNHKQMRTLADWLMSLKAGATTSNDAASSSGRRHEP
jgi:mono/diheme cytochrome c family protein